MGSFGSVVAQLPYFRPSKRKEGVQTLVWQESKLCSSFCGAKTFAFFEFGSIERNPIY